MWQNRGGPPVRGEYGEAEILLKSGAIPLKQRPYQMSGERRAAWVTLTDQLIAEGKLEPGRGPWNSPSFPVPKKKPGTWRLVVDFRALNEATITDSHPLPRIGEILQRQGKYKMWSVLDMKDGYHQVPLRREHRDLTCMSTPRGTMRWKVLVMGLKNGNAIFQRVMEEVLRDIDCADPYVDDIIVGSTGETEEELLINHEKDLRKVLETLKEAKLVADPKKTHLFVREVEFCGHILREGQRFPSPGKLMPIQKWQLPQTLTQLRGFLGLCNYYEEYVEGYAQLAWKLMEKLKVRGPDAKAGSQIRLEWNQEEIEAFNALKAKLAHGLSLHQVKPDNPFQLRTDASQTAVGAVLKQEHKEKWVPVCFFSRKLTSSQLNWTPRDKEGYAIVASLVKFAGWIGTTYVEVITDHKTLESWYKEYVETPSGPTGRRARWHEIFSQFTLNVGYQPGHTNLEADAMTRWAYPASEERQDVCQHGTANSAEMVKEMIRQENEEARKIDGWEKSPDEWEDEMEINAIKRRKSDECYRLTNEMRMRALEEIGVPKSWITMDLFANGKNATEKLFVNAKMDAFTYDWSQLMEHSDEVLWANPPFSMLDKVITKIILEPCKVVLVTPEWKDSRWWKPLDQITVARTYLPCDVGIYISDNKDDVLPHPAWRTAISLVDTTKWKGKLFGNDLEKWVTAKSKRKNLQDLKGEFLANKNDIMVSTRSGLQTETENDEEIIMENDVPDEIATSSCHDDGASGGVSAPIRPDPPWHLNSGLK